MSESTVTHMSKKEPWATVLAQDLYELPLSIWAQGGSTHSQPVPLGAAAPDTHVYLEAIVALHRELRHIRAGAEVDFSVKVISLQAQPLGHQCSASFGKGHLCLHPTVPWETGSALWEPGSVLQHNMASSNPRAASSVDGEHPRYPATRQPFSPPPTTDSPHRPCTLPSSSSSALAKSSLAPLPSFRRTWCLSPVMPELCSSPPWPGKEKGLVKGWPCLPPLRSSPGNISGSSQSARTNVSSTAGASGRGRQGKRQKGNG